MKNKLFLYGVLIAVAAGALYFAYRAGQDTFGDDFDRVVREELERIRGDYDGALLRYDGDIKELRAEFNERTKELERSFYALREELARAGVEITPTGIRRSPRDKPAVEIFDRPIAKETFHQLRTNMTRQDTERILGRPGALIFTFADSSGTKTENYRWSWTSLSGAPVRISVSFENGELRDKEYREETR